MDNQQDQIKNQPPTGQGIHGGIGHVCNKCGWPFPNPHPSAKHRRAHKKVCGTIDGYQELVEFDETDTSSHLPVSENYHLSDEDDYKTPSPNMLERSKSGNGGICGRSSRSEDDVFSDAVTEFSDDGSSPGIEENVEEFNESVIVKDAMAKEAITTPQILKGERITDDSSYIRNIPVQEINWEFKDATTCVQGNCSTDHETKELSGDPSRKQGGSANVVRCLESETTSQENKVIGEGSTGTVKHNESSSDGNILEVVSPNDNVAQETNSSCKVGNLEKASYLAPSNGVFQLKEEQTDGAQLPIPVNNLLAEDESSKEINSHAYVAQTKVNDAEIMHSDSRGDLTDYHSKNREPIGNMHVLFVPDNIPVVDNADIMIIGFKDHGRKLHPLTIDESLEVTDDAKDSFPKDSPSSLPLLPLDEGPVVSSPDMLVLEDNGTTNLMVVPHEVDSGTAESSIHNINKISEGLETLPEAAGTEMEKICSHPSIEERHPHDFSSNSSESISIKHSVSVPPEHNPMAANTETVESTNEFGNNTSDKEMIETSSDVAELDHTGTLEHDGTKNPVATTTSAGVLSVLERDARTNPNEGDDKHSKEGKTEVSNIYGIGTREVDSGIGTREVDSSLVSAEKNLSMTIGTKPEASLQEVESQLVVEDKVDDSKSKLADSGGTHIKRVLESLECQKEHESEIKRNVIPGSEAGESNILYETLAENTVLTERTAESGTTNVEKVNVGYQKNSPETECTNVYAVLGTSKCSKESESKMQADSDIVGMAAESDNGRTIQVNEMASEDHTTKEPQVSPSDAFSFRSNSPTTEDSYAKSSADLVTNNKVEPPSPGKGAFSTQQLGASALEFAVDSLSLTDSLEGHWGSVSVLSVQSDVLASVDAESLPLNGHQASAEAEKAILKNSKAPPEEQHYDKSDTFEPPSFMTLVEPKASGSCDQKADSSKIQTANNPLQPKVASSQAGWFPSLTHVMNDSQGRKKNEEIIAKVTKWSSGKQHAPIKSLVGEAKVETKPRLPKTRENPTSPAPKYGTTAKDTVPSAATGSSILIPEAPENEPVNKDARKEWNSPARYRPEMKREKRKVKGRPYWAQFVCCSGN